MYAHLHGLFDVSECSIIFFIGASLKNCGNYISLPASLNLLLLEGCPRLVLRYDLTSNSEPNSMTKIAAKFMSGFTADLMM
jgi:hypothetical protein